MVLNDVLANSLSLILNAEKNGRTTCLVRPASRLVKKVLEVFSNQKFLGTVTEINDGRGGILKIELLGKINKCGAIKPRFAVNLDTYEKFEKRYMPAKNFGLMIVSTSKGIMNYREAKEKGIGGKIIAYCY